MVCINVLMRFIINEHFQCSDYVDMLMEIGFSIERIFADWEDEAPHEESERIFFQVRK